MGVMPCSRSDCSNILCGRHSTRFGYICEDCFHQLVSLGIQTDIQTFLDTPIDTDFKEEHSYEYFDDIFEKD